MERLPIPTRFSVEFVGNFEKMSDLLLKGRVRIYYPGVNRNGTWITDEFAEELNKTVVYIPIVGSYGEDDFEGHADNGNKKIYGFVPFDHNPTWEEGEDGRKYFAVDVILWVGYEPNAEQILKKAQSMELDPNSIVGDWKVIGGEYFFVYQSARFKGLCALGDDVLPCFEESAFYSLNEKDRSFFAKFKLNTGGKTMSKDINEEAVDNSTVEETIASDSFEENATEGNDSVETIVADAALETQTEDFASETEDVPEDFASEEQSSEVMYDTQRLTIVEESNVAIANEDGSTSYISEEKVQTIAITTYYELQAECSELKNRIQELETANAELTSYKDTVITNQKQDLIKLFSKKLTEEELSPFVEKIKDFSITDLKTQLSLLVAEKALNEESPQDAPVNYVRMSCDTSSDEVENILKKYKK